MKFSLLGFKVEISKASQLPETKHQAQAKPEYKELEPVINKPVRDFVETFHSRPRSFICKRIFTSFRDPVVYELFDTSESILFKATLHHISHYGGIDMAVEVNGKYIYLTEDEKAFLRTEVEYYYRARAKKLSDIKQSRIRRDLSKIYA